MQPGDNRIDRHDPRFRLPPDHPLGGSDWYRSLPERTRVSLGLDLMCQVLRYAIAFESCLSRGLLEFVETLPARCPQYRYAMHEVVEESHHSMMFREFIDRSDCEPAGLPAFNRIYNRLIVRWAATFPELFFLHVLSGEIFTDHDKRERLAQRDGLHPLVRRMIQIHVMEEARHVRFAEAFLRERVPRLPRWRKWQIRALLPVLLDQGERMMLRPIPKLVRQYAIPVRVMADAFGAGSAHERRSSRDRRPFIDCSSWTAARDAPGAAGARRIRSTSRSAASQQRVARRGESPPSRSWRRRPRDDENVSLLSLLTKFVSLLTKWRTRAAGLAVGGLREPASFGDLGGTRQALQRVTHRVAGAT